MPQSIPGTINQQTLCKGFGLSANSAVYLAIFLVLPLLKRLNRPVDTTLDSRFDFLDIAMKHFLLFCLVWVFFNYGGNGSRQEGVMEKGTTQQ